MHCLLLIQEYSQKDNSNIINKLPMALDAHFMIKYWKTDVNIIVERN